VPFLASLSGGDVLLLLTVLVGCAAWIRLLLFGDHERELRRIERIFGSAGEPDREHDAEGSGSAAARGSTPPGRAGSQPRG
jgi:hypothetical protein